MSACYFLSSVCLVPKANLGEDDKPQLHLLVQQPGLAHRKSLGVCNPPWKLGLGDFLLPSFHFVCSWYCWTSCEWTSRKGKHRERSHSCKEPSLLSPSPRCQCGWSRADTAHPRVHAVLTAAPLVWEANCNLPELASLLLISISLEKLE